MKIVYIYPKISGYNHSIRRLFNNISDVCKLDNDVIEYNLSDSYLSIIKDIITLRKLKADVYHITGVVNYVAPLLPLNSTVLTIHDIDHYLHGLSGLKKIIYKILWLQIPVLFCKKITVVSHKTEQLLVKHLGSICKGILQISNCCNPIYKFHDKEFSKNKIKILQIGTGPQKNISKLIDALQGMDIILTIIGRIDPNVKRKLSLLNIEYVNYINISDEEIYVKYQDTDIVAFVSVREGFGIPIIEAQAIGRVVITSNRSPMSDIAGNGACLVNPDSVDDIRKSIIKIITNEKYRADLINNGRKNCSKYSSNAIALKYTSLYQSIVNDK